MRPPRRRRRLLQGLVSRRPVSAAPHSVDGQIGRTPPAGRSRWRGRRSAATRAARWVSRWSNQWAVLSCSARNRVIGGSAAAGRPSRLSQAQTASTAAPARIPPAAGHVPAAAARRHPPPRGGEQLGDRSGLAVGHHQRPTVHLIDPVDGGDQGIDGVVQVRGVDQRGTRARGSAACRAGPGRRSERPAGCRRVPRPGADGWPAPGARRRRRPGRSARPSPCCGRSARGRASGSAGPAPTPTRAEPAWATEGDDTCTRRGTPRSRQAVTTMPVPVTLVRRNSGQRPEMPTLAARWTTAS